MNMLITVYISDRAWFHLSGDVNSQNSRLWTSENLHLFHKVHLHPEKLRVWSALTHWHVVGPIFFEKTDDGNAYWDIIITQFILLLQVDEHDC
jgi:hypothetical protein